MTVISGELENVWLAAKSDKRLKKMHYNETELRNAVRRVIQNTDKRFTLQLQAQLLVGIVRIYQKKMSYLSDDCQDAMKSSFSYEKKKKLLLQPEKSKGSSKKAKHLQDASQLDALYELPDLSLSELQAKLEEEALIQRADAHQARDSELQMDEYLLDQPNETSAIDDLEDDGFDYTFDLGLDVNKILKSVVEDGFSGDLASLLESAPPMDIDDDDENDSNNIQEPSEDFQGPPEIEESAEFMQEPELDEEPPQQQFEEESQFEAQQQFEERPEFQPEPEFQQQAEFQQEPEFQQPQEFQEQPQFQEPQNQSRVDIQPPYEEEQPPQEQEYQPEQPPSEQLVSPVQPPVYNQDYSAYSNDGLFPQSFQDGDEIPERSTLDLVHKSYEAGDEVQFKDAGELGLDKDDEDWYEPEAERMYRYETENLDAQEDISDFSEDDATNQTHHTPRKNKKTPKKRKKNFTPKKRQRKRKKNFRDDITELTSEWIRDSISNTTAIIYKKRPSVELTRFPSHLHDRSKDGMDSLIEMPFVRGLAPQLLKMFQQKVWTRCHTFTNREFMEDPDLNDEHQYYEDDYPIKFDNEGDYDISHYDDYNEYGEEYGDYQLAGDPDLGVEKQYLSENDEPPRKRMKTHHETEEMMAPQPHNSLPPEVSHEQHEVVHEDINQDMHQEIHQEAEEEPIVNEEPPEEEPFEVEPSLPQDAEPQVGTTPPPQQREITQEQPTLQDGFTYKTLQTMQFLGSQEERTLSFRSLTEGQSCKVAAGLFYELLVIRSKGMVQLDQPEPYGDTKISKCDQFDDFLQM